MRWAVLAACLLLAAPALADGVKDARATLLDAVRANGCAMTEAEADALLPRLGLTREAVAAVAADLVTEGAAVPRGANGIELAPVVCAGSDAAAGGPLGALVAAAEPRDCALTAADAAAALRGQGLDRAGAKAVLRSLEGAGHALLAGDGVILLPSVCGGGMPGSPAMDVRRRVAAAEWVQARLAAEPGCALPRAGLAGEGVAVGIGPADLDQALADLWGRGELAPSADPVGLADDDCAGAGPVPRGAVGPSLEAAILVAMAERGCDPQRPDGLADAVEEVTSRVARRIGLPAGDDAARVRLRGRVERAFGGTAEAVPWPGGCSP